ncbi:MAG: hypothetical protein KAR39_07520 [Thermoplasmata archaeon]|nr:hypothetical protein [Thermoplasmata archaeon]
MPINASQDTFNEKFLKAQGEIDEILKEFSKDLGNYGFTGVAGATLTCEISGKDTARPMFLNTEATYGFKAR